MPVTVVIQMFKAKKLVKLTNWLYIFSLHFQSKSRIEICTAEFRRKCYVHCKVFANLSIPYIKFTNFLAWTSWNVLSSLQMYIWQGLSSCVIIWQHWKQRGLNLRSFREYHDHGMESRWRRDTMYITSLIAAVHKLRHGHLPKMNLHQFKTAYQH